MLTNAPLVPDRDRLCNGDFSVKTERVVDESLTADLDLLRRIAGGNSDALGGFYDLHSGTLFALALRILNDSKEAEDVIQEVFLQLWEKAGTFNPEQGRPLAWVITLTRNKAIDRLRSAQRRAKLVTEVQVRTAPYLEIYHDTGNQSGHGDEAQLVLDALRRLPPDHRRAIELAFFGGLTQTEVAAALNEPLGTIKARIRRGMLKLREELESKLWKIPTTEAQRV